MTRRRRPATLTDPGTLDGTKQGADPINRAGRMVAAAATRTRVLRTRTHVTKEAVMLAAALFALDSGSMLAADGLPAKDVRDAFAGARLRPPLTASLDLWTGDADKRASFRNRPG